MILGGKGQAVPEDRLHRYVIHVWYALNIGAWAGSAAWWVLEFCRMGHGHRH